MILPDICLFAATSLEAISTLGTVFVGVSVAVATFFGKAYYWLAIDLVEQDFRDKLRGLQVSTTHLRKYLIAWSVGLLAVLLGLWLLADSLVFGILAFLILFAGPWHLVRRRAEKHRQQVEDQLSDAIVTMSGAIKAGLSLAQALEVLAEQAPRPINAEFRRIVGEYQLGKPLDRTLEEAKDRLKSENFALFAAAMLASRESGGRLNETIDRIANSVRELQRLERKIESETAMAKKSAVYMAVAPFFILVLYYFIDPTAVAILFNTLPGQIVLAVAVLLNLLAYLWARLILNPDI